MNNFRTVSNLSFVSKVVEQAIVSQLNKYLADNDLLQHCQSAYRIGHSTETALLHVWSDMLMAANECRLTLLCMLNMSAAFDCVDHSILLRRLQVGAGITGVVLDWITSFLTGRTQQVTYNSQLSVMQTVMIGPLLYVLYTAELSEVITRHGLNFISMLTIPSCI